MGKTVIHVSEAEAVNGFAKVLEHVRAGAEVVIDGAAHPIAIVNPAEPPYRLLSESLRIARERGSTATIDEDFARDVEAAVNSHREPLDPPAWD